MKIKEFIQIRISLKRTTLNYKYIFINQFQAYIAFLMPVIMEILNF